MHKGLLLEDVNMNAVEAVRSYRCRSSSRACEPSQPRSQTTWRNIRKFASALCLAALCSSANAAVPPSVEDQAKTRLPVIPGAHFHHVHMNVTDPAAAIAFYTTHFKAVPAVFGGEPAVWVQRSWILLTKVSAEPGLQDGTAINHFGWGSPNPPEEYQRQKSLGATFVTDLTDISAVAGGPPKSFYFMNVRGPNNSTIEINTSPTTNFGHIHFMSADPVSAATWYHNMFGVTSAPPVFPDLVVQSGNGVPLHIYLFDNISMIFTKSGDFGSAPGPLRSTLGSVTDHISVSVPSLNAALAAARARHVTVLEDASDGPCKPCRRALIEGPDKIAIELIEDHGVHPPITE